MIESVEMLYYNVEDKCYGKFSHSLYFLLNKNSFYSILILHFCGTEQQMISILVAHADCHKKWLQMNRHEKLVLGCKHNRFNDKYTLIKLKLEFYLRTIFQNLMTTIDQSSHVKPICVSTYQKNVATLSHFIIRMT